MARRGTAAPVEVEGQGDGSLFKQVVDLIGAQAGAALCRRFGGRRLHIPKDPAPNHPIAVVIGPVEAKFLGQQFGGLRIDIPMSHGRREEVVRLLGLGWTPARIAETVPCTERWVYAIREEVAADTGEQLDLFRRAG